MTGAPLVSALANNCSVFHKALMFLMRLAWKSRIRLPYLIMVGFMVGKIKMIIFFILIIKNF